MPLETVLKAALVVAVAGMAFLPIITLAAIIAGVDVGYAVGGMAAMYGAIITVVTPIATRRRNGINGHDADG